jgi:hypothetical protein
LDGLTAEEAVEALAAKLLDPSEEEIASCAKAYDEEEEDW